MTFGGVSTVLLFRQEVGIGVFVAPVIFYATYGSWGSQLSEARFGSNHIV